MSEFVDTIKQLGTARLAIMGGVIVGLLLFFVFLSLRVSSPEHKLLYDNLSSVDSSAMATRLGTAKIPFEVSEDGSRIMVAEDKVGEARMLLAQEGLPNGGTMGYEVFDEKAGFGTTNFVQNINQVRALEGELARTIGSLDQIRSSRVHLVLPQRELFSRDSRPASASVFLALRPGAQLAREQILSIQSLVSSAGPGLKATSVSVIDSNGNLLARGGEEQDSVSMKSEEMSRSYEQRMTQTIEDIVGRVVGYGRVRANVTAELNFDRISTNEELYDPATQVVRSSQVTEESSKESQPVSTDVSVQNNLPGIAGELGGGAQPSAQASKIEETTNYEISKTTRSLVREVGEVKRMSVAVLVDGNYTTDKDGKKTYTPRDQNEIDRITALVKSAIGYSEKRGDTVEVVNLQFAQIDAEDESIVDTRLFGFDRGDLLDAVEIITITIMIILVVLLVLQPMVGRLLASQTAIDEGLEAELLAGHAPSPALAAPENKGFEPPSIAEEDSLIDMKQVEGKVKASSVKKVEDIVSNYPNETVSVIRSWMSHEQ